MYPEAECGQTSDTIFREITKYRVGVEIAHITKDETRLNSSTRQFLARGRSDDIFDIDNGH